MDTLPDSKKEKENYGKKFAKTFLWSVDFLWRTVIITVRLALWGMLSLGVLYCIMLCFDPARATQSFEYIKTWFI